MLTQAGWICQIEQESSALVVRIFRGDMRTRSGNERPELKFDLHRTAGITVSQALPANVPYVSADNASYSVDEVTPDFVEKRVTQFVELLVMK
jgi:hypothetical protein